MDPLFVVKINNTRIGQNNVRVKRKSIKTYHRLVAPGLSRKL